MEKIIIFKLPIFNRHGMMPTLPKLLNRSGAQYIKPLPLVNGVVCKFAQDVVEQEITQLSEVLALEDNMPIKLPPFRLERGWPLFSSPWQQKQVIPWGVEKIGANKTWFHSRGENVRVAVMDSGVDLEHPDLISNIKGGINIIDPTQKPVDDNGHGTHVAGTIAAEDNNIGVVGVAPAVHLYAVKTLDHRGEGTVADVIKGLEWCIRNKMQLLNLSVGTQKDSISLKLAVQKAFHAGLIMISAAGNNSIANSVDYPAAYPEVVAVGAIDEYNRLSTFSSRGPEVTVVAPGSGILSTLLDGIYARLSGTSMAAPHVTGLVALLLEINPCLSVGQLIMLLQKTSKKLPGLAVEEQGFGLVNAEKIIGML